MNNLINKVIIASGASLVVTENVQLQPLWTALITLAVSVITVLTAEGIAWLKAWFNKKKAKEEAEQHKYEEEDFVAHASEIEEKSKDKEE